MNVKLEHKVESFGEDVSIDTPFDIDFNDIKQILIEQTSSVIKRLSIYPNGFIVYFEQQSNKVTFKTNWPMEKLSDGKYTVKESS